MMSEDNIQNNNDTNSWYFTNSPDLLTTIDRLEQENTKLRIALCNLRDEYLDMGGDPNQLELFDKNDVSQLRIFED